MNINPIWVTVAGVTVYAILFVRERRYGILLKQIKKLYEAEQYIDTIAICGLILKWSPYKGYIHYSRGIVLSEIGRYEEAIVSYDQALKYGRLFGGVHIGGVWIARGDALFNLECHKESIENYDKALKYKNKNKKDEALIWYKRGTVLLHLNLYTEALSNLEKSLRYDPNDWHYLTGRGSALTYLQRYEESLNNLNQALQNNPEFVPAFYAKACCYALQGNTDQAIENLTQVSHRDPENFREQAKVDTDLATLRLDPRFQKLVNG
jgi:tetratricopeptide (TPR) repeat protein